MASVRLARRGALGISFALLLGTGAAQAGSPEYLTPHVATDAGPVTVEVDGAAYTNQGLAGAGRLSANLMDFMGDSLGSFSSMAVVPGSWRRDGDHYTAKLVSLPDRGFNDPDKNFYSDYQGRLVEYDLTFTPYSGPALPAAAQSQRQIVLQPTGRGIKLTDFTGAATTGLDPDAHTVTQQGHVLPSPADGPAAGKVSLDAEAIAFRADGSFYVGDEYTAGIYLFGADGRMKGFIAPPAALLPMSGGAVDYGSNDKPETGRRNNQGMEAVAITPDGARLIAVLQSGTIQDSAGNAGDSNNTRILVYDISADPAPKAPVEHYVLQLPIFAGKGDGGPADKAAAQSEVVALDGHRLLVLSRDGNGLGCGCKAPEVYKSILLVDTKGATNLAGTDFETTIKPISKGRALDTAITPVRTVDLVNMLNTTQLGNFGLNIDNAAAGPLTLSEKWEAMALVPALDAARPNDYFLLVANDNDFQTTKGLMQGVPYDAGLTNDNMILAYRLTLPTAGN